MREILFRGKAKDGYKWIAKGEWIEGSLFYSDDGNETVCQIATSCLSSDKDKPVMMVAYEVAPETVCQYTGLTDRNGRKIFEGDILCNHYDESFPEAKTMSVIVWDSFRWGIKNRDVVDGLDDFDCKNGEVVGNIFDNPELADAGGGVEMVCGEMERGKR